MALFAFYLDSKIRKESGGTKSLDDLMLTIKEDAVKHQQKLNHEYFLSKANEYLKDDITPFFNKHIINGSLFNHTDIFNEFYYEFHPITEVFDLGFTFSEIKNSLLILMKARMPTKLV